jgi:hypothetical protein
MPRVSREDFLGEGHEGAPHPRAGRPGGGGTALSLSSATRMLGMTVSSMEPGISGQVQDGVAGGACACPPRSRRSPPGPETLGEPTACHLLEPGRNPGSWLPPDGDEVAVAGDQAARVEPNREQMRM